MKPFAVCINLKSRNYVKMVQKTTSGKTKGSQIIILALSVLPNPEYFDIIDSNAIQD